MNEKEYLNQLSKKLQEFFGTNLVGLYQIGSGSLNDYRNGQSDLDIVALLSCSMNKQDKDELAMRLEHKNFPCPSEGLDLVIFTENTVTNLVKKPYYEFWFATGKSWKSEGWEEGANEEMLIFIELSRKSGKILFGKDPKLIFTPVKNKWLLKSFLQMLYWHQKTILDPFHDPLGKNSILNACRVLAFTKEGKLISKTAGGEWFLKNEANNNLVKGALAIRNGKFDVNLEKKDIFYFLEKIIDEIKTILILKK